jgi:hypothetical protein
MKIFRALILLLLSLLVVQCSQDELVIEKSSVTDKKNIIFNHESFSYSQIQGIDLLGDHLYDHLDNGYQKSSNTDLSSFISTIDSTEVSRMSYENYESYTFMINPLTNTFSL